MRFSTDRILTSHVGSLPRPAELLALYRSGAGPEALDAGLRAAVADVVARQADAGIDIVNDGEYGKPMADDVEYGSFAFYVYGRLGGYALEEVDETEWWAQTAEGQAFPGFYRSGEADSKAADAGPVKLGRCVGPITYERPDLVQRDAANLRAALGDDREAFITALSAGGAYDLPGTFYPSADDEAVAVAEALNVEYRAIADAGFVVQLDDPHIVDTYFFQYAGDPDQTAFRRWAERHVELVNLSLEGIPAEQVRLHICWGSWKGPHSTDLPLADVVDLMLRIDAGLYSIEAANPRHEHEWKVWRDVTLPEGKILMPGVVSHKTNILEHPELVADRIMRYAELVGRENVIAGTDCGMGGRIHPEIAWAKLKVLAEGAERASRELWR